MEIIESVSEYRECLGIIPTIIEKYEPTHEMVLCGDMNGTIIAIPPLPFGTL
jgi:hypothetical protein